MSRPSTPTRRRNAGGTGITIGSSKGSSSFFFSSNSKNEKVNKNTIPTISIRRAMLTRLIGPLSTLIVRILICYEGAVITKSYSNKIDIRNQYYQSNLRRRKLLQQQVVGSSTNTNEYTYTYVDEYTQHNEYVYVDDNEEVNSNDEVDDPHYHMSMTIASSALVFRELLLPNSMQPSIINRH